MSTDTIYDLTHHFNFISDNTGEVQIDEPIGFDAAAFVVEQDKKRYGRDVSFSGEELDFTFSSIKNKYGHYFEKLVEYDKIYGYESEVEYIIKENGVPYVVGNIDFNTKESDQIKEFKCKFIQDVSQAILKRREDVKVNVFSNKDLDNEDITPLATTNVLLKAKPIVQVSSWRKAGNDQNGFAWLTNVGGDYSLGLTGVNNIYAITNGEIENTLSFISTRTNLNSYGFPSATTYTYVEALNDINNLKIDITNFDCRVQLSVNDPQGLVNSFSGYSRLVIKYGADTDTGDDLTTIVLQQFDFDQDSFPIADQYYNTEFSETINLTRNERVWIYVEHYMEYDADPYISGFPPNIKIDSAMFDGNIDMEGTSVSIDSVVKAVRFVDLMRQNASSVKQTFVLDAPRFDSGGEWYDNFVFNGSMIRGLNTEFMSSWKFIANALQEFNSDYEINGNDLFIGKYDDFYRNEDMGAFLIAPDGSFKTTYNELYSINRFLFYYKTFNQDKDDSNTIDSVHTETDWLNANKQVENFKEIKLEQVRDPFELETTRKKGIATKETTSLTQDDKVFMNDCVPLAPSTRGGFTASMVHYVDEDGFLKIMNDDTYNWTVLGFNIGSLFTITNTANAGNYIVIDYVSNIITLSPIVVTPTSLEEIQTTVDYPYENVEYTIRTNEGFDLIENILSSDNYGNLLYTPKRNILNNWSSYLKTASKYKPEVILNTYFKNSPADDDGLKLPNLTTQFDGGAVITENADIEQSELTDMLVTPELITSKLLMTFAENKQLESDIKTKRGFIRIYDNDLRVRKVFLQKKAYEPKDNVAEIVGEVKFESEYTTIEKIDGIYIINEVGYNEDIVPSLEYIATDNNIQLFDINTRPLTNSIRYDFVSVDGVTYDSVIELAEAIESL